jgi:hypothetical protein
MTRGVVRVVVTCALAILLGTPAQAREKVCGEPLRGPSSGTITVVPAPPVLHILFTGSAHVSGLGLSEIVFDHDLALATGAVTGNMVITAANGDELYASVVGSAIPSGPGTMTLDQIGTIVGGTGRFADAEGTFTIKGTKFPDLVVTVVMDGYLERNRDCD